jgi:hypothetical protein
LATLGALFNIPFLRTDLAATSEACCSKSIAVGNRYDPERRTKEISMKPLVPMPGAMPRGYSFRLPGDTRKSSQSTESSESEALGRQTSRRELYEYDDYSPEDYKSPHFDGGNEDKYSEQEPVAVAITDASYVSEARESCRPSYASGQQMIALFGGTGVTGGHFMTTALDAGYRVRCTPADDPREVEQPSGWEAIQQSLEDPEQIKEVVCGVDYVVIMLNDVLPGKLDYPAGFMVSFIDRLYTILRSETHVQVVLLQVGRQSNSRAMVEMYRIPVLILFEFFCRPPLWQIVSKARRPSCPR